jgi:hypothetical protein
MGTGIYNPHVEEGWSVNRFVLHHAVLSDKQRKKKRKLGPILSSKERNTQKELILGDFETHPITTATDYT